VLLSPAKKLDLKAEHNSKKSSFPEFLGETSELIKILKGKSANDLKELMHISDNIAELNEQRYQNFKTGETKENAYPAALTFAGEVYNGLNARDFSEKELNFANQNLRILSGLYGLLKPSDLIQAYRLEMGSKLNNPAGKNLYRFWQEKLTKHINDAEQEVIINLASNEYFKALKENELKSAIITPVFQDFKNGSYKTIMMYAKKARGLMARYIIKNEIRNWQKIKFFDSEGYIFNPDMSDLDCKNKKLVFTRG